ncbi:MAG: hypothetical protein D6755_14065, partial [Anaerolineae bacterium]
MADTMQTTRSSFKQESTESLRVRPTRILIYLILIAGAVLAILPFFWMVSTSLMTLGETINRRWLPAVPQFSNYVEAWTEAQFSKY